MSLLHKVMSVLGLADEETHVQEPAAGMYEESEVNSQVTARKGGTVVNIHTQKQVRVVLLEAKEYDDAQTIADHLRSRRTVILNLHKAPYEIALRLLDFMSGTVYAIGGRMEKLGPNVFLFAPENVEIQGFISDWLETQQVQTEDARQMGR